MSMNRVLLSVAISLLILAWPVASARAAQSFDFDAGLSEGEKWDEGDDPAREERDDPARAELRRRASALVDEIVAASYPELRQSEIRIKFFQSESDYFRAGFSYCRFLTGRRMRFFLLVNRRAFERQAPETALRAIIAHELSHILYFKERNRLRLLGLIRLVSGGYTIRFERRADLLAIARGYGDGLKEYRRWLYTRIPQTRIAEKRRNYFSPEEIDGIASAVRDRPGLLACFLKRVPRNLREITEQSTPGDEAHCAAKR